MKVTLKGIANDKPVILDLNLDLNEEGEDDWSLRVYFSKEQKVKVEAGELIPTTIPEETTCQGLLRIFKGMGFKVIDVK